ncbi:hypothetical protein K504DRAFT_377165 [Pleomassaria siparia CBS 279.74]|uniref:Homeobox domain-containing protein n=1 Tax=Pleomassaria siparia CBS 279.74 TaxID=1314801 RepID=A0A6G1KAV3_9PLEO|nr:hypothetical protein K504DRAFT_377165 [Pleomassaria siparia CBS 279.74]
MSDSSLQSSSPSSSANSTNSNEGIAFLVHSQRTVEQGLPYVISNKPLARQKRRRTSKEDEDILRAEYVKNCKPDKAARMQIVNKVSLAEKEVQIWFQNKRQNDRRRSRPLHPSSSASLMSSSSAMSDPAVEEDAAVREPENKEEVETDPKNEVAEERVDDMPMSKPEDLDPPAPLDDKSEEPVATRPAEVANTESRFTIESTTVTSTEAPVAQVPADTAPAKALPSSSQNASQPRTSWISNRRSASFMRSNDDYASEIIAFPTMTAATSSEPSSSSSSSASTTRNNLKRTHSFVRLSMTDDGTARVITDADKTPSPPHAKSTPASLSRAAAGLRRSYSAAAFNERLIAASHGEERSPKIARTSTVGRSHDSRAWEFWCDPETRYNTSLTARAEQEGSGSAADAIGLLRANRRVLTPNPTRRNTPILTRNQSSKGAGVKKSRGPIQRAFTAHGRIQTKEHKTPKRKNSDTSSEDLPATESDKENWEPEIPSSAIRRPRASQTTPCASQRSRQILGENTDIMSQSTSFGALLAKERRKGSVEQSSSENEEDLEQDEELRGFMAGGGLSGRTSINSAEEAGCVEGLLKLSQGNWR